MLKAVLIDDEQESITGLKLKLAATCPEVEVVYTATDPRNAIVQLQELRADLLFLDIEMPGMNGFSLLEALPTRHFEVIMVTAYSEYAMKALKANALDYLLKPVDTDELREAVNKVILKKEKEQVIDARIEELAKLLRHQKMQTGKLALHGAKEVHIVQIENIVRVEGENNYSVFYMNNGGKFTVTKTLKDYEEQLTGNGFFRVHKSHIINLNFLVKLNRTDYPSVVMSDGSEIEISVRRKADFLKALEVITS